MNQHLLNRPIIVKYALSSGIGKHVLWIAWLTVLELEYMNLYQHDKYASVSLCVSLVFNLTVVSKA
jgi:hypothetical protein